ncbi:hypothetical protein D1841_05245, partial [Neglecta sp. X4]|nr:hypothetical protein [Neglectibacter sp. X4]NCE80615.1 hypothetical protein [Neglectibacter sp. X58]
GPAEKAEAFPVCLLYAEPMQHRLRTKKAPCCCTTTRGFLCILLQTLLLLKLFSKNLLTFGEKTSSADCNIGAKENKALKMGRDSFLYLTH